MRKTITMLAAVAVLILLPLLSAAQGNKQGTDANKPQPQRIELVYHTVKPGETVYSIAKTYHADVTEIFKLNPGSKDIIWAGATLLIPSTSMDTIKPDAEDTLHIREHLEEFISEMDKIADTNVENLDEISEANRKLSQLNTKWNVYYQAKQANIADNDALTELVTQYQQLNQEAKDTLAATKNHILLLANFNKADKFIASQMGVYKELSRQALELSAISALATKLKSLKVKEQLVFADIDKNYEAAKAAAAQNPQLGKRMAQITNNYVELKNQSEKIQAAEYKPLFDRIKNYLFGIAAVTIILMFINMMQSKIQAAKQAKEAARKLEKFRQQHDDEYPTI